MKGDKRKTTGELDSCRPQGRPKSLLFHPNTLQSANDINCTWIMPSARRPATGSVNSNDSQSNNGHARAPRTNRTTNNRRQQNKGDNRRFHPNLITAQIVSFQCFQYLAQSILFQINAFLYESSTVSVDRLFTDKYVHLFKTQGWPDCAAIFFAALIG